MLPEVKFVKYAFEPDIVFIKQEVPVYVFP